MNAFVDAFDFAFTIKHEVEIIMGQTVPLKMFTDSKCLFAVITKSFTTAKKRLMIDICTVREEYQDNDIRDVGFVGSDDTSADVPTRNVINDVFNNIIHKNIVEHHTDQCVLRDWKKNYKINNCVIGQKTMSVEVHAIHVCEKAFYG